MSDKIITGLVIATFVGLFAFIYIQTGKMNDCTERGGAVIDTSGGWVCAKIVRI